MPLNADERGGVGPNGKPSLTVEAAAENLIRPGLSWSFAGQGTTLTYAFRKVAPRDMPSDTSGFSAFTPAQMAATERALLAWSDVANLTFIRVEDNGGAPVMRFGNFRDGEVGAAAFAYYPGSRATNALEGDVWVRSPSASNAELGRGGQGDYILVHEIGHALGLAHPGEYDADDDASYEDDAFYYEDTRFYSVMSYFGSVNTGTVQPEASALFANAPQLDDVAAIQRLYGANLATRAGDTIYGFNSNTDRTWYTLSAATDGLYVAIWDGGGTDTLDFSGYAQNQRIDLREGAVSDVGPSIGSVSIAIGATIENAIGGVGGDSIRGNAAGNFLQGGGGGDRLVGGAGSDLLGGDDGDDAIYGEDGDDAVGGGLGADLVEGGLGSDRLYGEAGADRLDGQDGADLVDGGGGVDVLSGGEGDDLIGGGDEGDELIGGGGRDTLYGDAGDDVLRGGEGADVLGAADGADTVSGEGGDDLAGGGEGDDHMDGGGGVDFLYGENGADILLGGEGNDLLDGSAGDDTLVGQGGRDIMGAGDGADILDGGEDDDQMYGENGDDQLFGRFGADFLMGQSGADLLDGGEGSDTLIGGEGDDRLIGYEGFDSLFGEGGADIFDLGALAGFDVAVDFNRFDGDRIALAGLRFTGLLVSDLNADGTNDSTLTYAGGTLVALNVGDLDLAGWNGLVI